VSDAPAHSLFDLLADYTIDGAPERTLPPEAAPVDVPAPVDDVASAPSEQVTGKTRSRLLRRRPLTAKRRMDDALASVRVEVKAEALKRMLEADAEAPGDAEVPVQPEVAVVVEPGVVEDEVVAADVDEPEDTVVDPPEVALEARAAVEVAEPPENAASASTEAEPVAELPVRSRWAWRG